MKISLIGNLMFFFLISYQTSQSIAYPNNIKKNVATTETKNECDLKPLKTHQLANGLKLRMLVENKIRTIIEAEKKKNKNPKVFIIGRAGQDLSGALVLKDNLSNNSLSLETIFNQSKVIASDGSLANINGSIDKDLTIREIKNNYLDMNRNLTYSHVGILVLDHEVTKKQKTMPDGTVLSGGDYWIEELLKPCENLKPKSWVTGLSQFFQDDPHQYRSIIYVPDQKIQDEIYNIITAEGFHNNFLGKKYNAAGNYNYLKTSSTKDDRFHHEQNSNQYILEIIAAAQINALSGNSTVQNRDKAVHVLHQWNYSPTKILANSFMTSMATSFFAPDSLNIRNELHPYARPYNIVEMVTELSVREYLLRTRAITPSDIYEAILPKNEILQEIK